MVERVAASHVKRSVIYDTENVKNRIIQCNDVLREEFFVCGLRFPFPLDIRFERENQVAGVQNFCARQLALNAVDVRLRDLLHVYLPFSCAPARLDPAGGEFKNSLLAFLYVGAVARPPCDSTSSADDQIHRR